MLKITFLGFCVEVFRLHEIYIFLSFLSLNFQLRKICLLERISLGQKPHGKNAYPIFDIPQMPPKNKSTTLKRKLIPTIDAYNKM